MNKPNPVSAAPLRLSGPEHFAAAQEYLADAGAAEPGSDVEMYSLAAAQVHATLAQTACIYDASVGRNVPAWSAATGGSSAGAK